MTVNSDRNKYVEDSKVDILLAGLFSSMPATVLNATILIVVLWQLIPHRQLITWYVVNTLYVLIRYAAIQYDKKNKANYSFKVRKTVILTSFIIAGLLFSASGFFIVSLNNVEYVGFQHVFSQAFVVGSFVSFAWP